MTAAAPPLLDWQSLAAGATRAHPTFVVWKHGAELVRGRGDLDATAVVDARGALVDVVRSSAAAAGLRAVVTCTHVPGRLVVVAAGGAAGDELAQVDLLERAPLGAGAWFDAEWVARLAFVDERGVRRLHPGAEGLLRLLVDPADGEARALVGADPHGLDAAASLLALPRALALAAARGSRPARFACAAVATVAARDRAVRRFRPCVVTDALVAGRRAPEGAAAFLARAAETHEVIDLA